jgi:hypothetical protein
LILKLLKTSKLTTYDKSLHHDTSIDPYGIGDQVKKKDEAGGGGQFTSV